MNVFPQDNWKPIVYLVVFVIVLAVACGLAMGDADIFNLPTARAEAFRIVELTKLEVARGVVELAQHARWLEAKTTVDIDMLFFRAEEAKRMERARNDQRLRNEANAALASTLFWLLARIALLSVGIYVLLVLIRRTLDRLLPPGGGPRPPDPPPPSGAGQGGGSGARSAGPPAAGPSRPAGARPGGGAPASRPAGRPIGRSASRPFSQPADPWRDPAYRRRRRQQARDAERENRRRGAGFGQRVATH